MSHQSVPAANGLQWLTEAVSLIMKNPTPFALMGLLLGIVASLPILGGLALAILGPALYGGVMYAAKEQQEGRNADFQHLFQAFREEGKLGRMLMLCLPGIAAGLLIGVLAVIFLGGALLSAGVAGATDSGAALGLGLGAGGLVFALIAFVVAVTASAMTFFATPQVMLKGAEPIAEMKRSLRACIDNIGAILLLAVVVFLVAVIAGVVLGFIPLIGQLLLMMVLLPVMSVTSYQGWRQVYRHDITQELPPTASSTTESSEPPTGEPPAPPASGA
jgi:hypothetical protein